jgi:hypothetical protein
MLKFRKWLEEQENKEDLEEQAKASEGDLEDYRTDSNKNSHEAYKAIRVKSRTVIKNNWTKVGDIKDRYKTSYDVYKLNNSNVYGIVSEEVEDDDTTRFIFVTEVELSSEKVIGQKLKMDDLYRVSEIITMPGNRGDGLGLNLYKFFVKTLKMNILGDSEQYFGARKLWSRLSKENDIIVDIVDISSGEFTEKDTIIHHGELDDEFDKKIWRSEGDISTHHIRLLLKDIK